MADGKEIEIKVKTALDTANSAKSLADIKKSLKELKSAALEVGEGGAGFRELTQQANELQDKLDDLKDSSKSLQGTGIEKLKSSFGLLTESFENADFGKLKIALKGLGTAMKAVPIFLIVEGVMYLVENFEKLSKGSGLLGKALRLVGDIITKITEGITWLLDKLGLVNSALDKQGEALTKSAEKAKTAIENQNTAYDQQIAVAKAAGKETVELETKKQEAIIKTNKALVEQAIAYVKAGGELSEDQKKALTEQLKAIKQASNDKKVIAAADAKKDSDEVKKNGAEMAALRIAIEEDARKKELLQQEKAYADNIKLAHGNAELLKNLKEQNQLKIYDINLKYDTIEKEANKAKLKEIEAEELASSQYLGLLDKIASDEKQAEIDRQVQAHEKGEADKLAASLERYDADKKREAKERKERIDGINIFLASIGNAFKQMDSEFGKLGASITTNLTNAFAAISKEGAKLTDKIQAGLQAVSGILSAINEYQNKNAQDREAKLEADLAKNVNQVESSKNAELNVLTESTNQQLANENLSADEKTRITNEYNAKKAAIENKAVQTEYQLKVSAYNRETEIKKKAFDQDRKMKIATAIINTVSGALAAVTGMIAAIPGPGGIIAGALAGAAVAALGAIQIAQIRNTKFDAGTPPEPPSLALYSGSDANADNQIQSQDAPKLKRIGRNGSDDIPSTNNQGSNSSGDNVQRIYVTTEDINSAQNKQAVLERRASF